MTFDTGNFDNSSHSGFSEEDDRGSSFNQNEREKTRPAAPGPLADASRSEPVTSNGDLPRVAVVDDEEMVGDALELLIHKRAEVDVYYDPREFMGALEKGVDYDVVFCDLMMPGMTGMDVYEVMEQKYPELISQIVFITGGAIGDRACKFLRDVDPPLLSKPARREQLCAYIEEFAPESRRSPRG